MKNTIGIAMFVLLLACNRKTDDFAGNLEKNKEGIAPVFVNGTP